MVWGESETYIDMKNVRIRELQAQLAERDRTIAALQERVRELEDALVEAIGTIRAWNGEATWDIYNTCSPEMKHINAALNPPAKERP